MTVRSPLYVLVATLVSLAFVGAAPAAYPGANGRIVFTGQPTSSTWEIYSAAPDGSDVKRLTWNGNLQSPVWSPDGSKIAYIDGSSGRWRIFVMNHDGSGARQVLDAGSNVDDMEPTWSPNGTQIAFASTRSSGWALWVVNADGTGLRQLTTGFGYRPAWSPDGSTIAYQRDNAVWLVSADGTGAHALTTGQYDEGPAWSPDGRTIVFSRRNFGGTVSELFAIDADGTNERQLTSGGYANYHAVFSPDGTKIAFQRRESATDYVQIFTMNADGSDVSKLMTSYRNNSQPDWGQSTVSPSPTPPQAPRIQIFSPQDGSFFLPGNVAYAWYGCSSEVSYIVSCVGDLPLGGQIDTWTAGTRTFTVRATDADGRETVASVTYTVFDIVAPHIDFHTPTEGARYVRGSDVRIDYDCVDDPGGLGIELCGGDLPSGAPLDTSRVGTFTFQAYAMDRARNLATARVTYQVVEPPAPTITIRTPGDGAVYTKGQAVTADYSCAADGHTGSAIVSCSGSVPSGSPIDTSIVGQKSFTVTAVDGDGNRAAVSRSYSVVYAFDGFFAPVASAPTVNSADAGKSIPLKFSLHGDQGLDVLASGSPVWRPCGSATGSTRATGTLAYTRSTDRYVFQVDTDKAWAGSCRELVLELRDGTVHRALFSFAK